MRFRQLGNSGPEVSVIGFGASPFGNVFGRVDPGDADAAVTAAIDRGINLFDVSPYYGLTVAETRLGETLVGKRDKVILGTKCGRYGAEHFDFSGETITRELESSLKRLKTDHVDILQAHDVEFGNFDQILQETIPALHRLKQQGKARWIGVTGYWPGFLARLAEQAELDCVLTYCHANVFIDDVDERLLPVIRQKGMGLFNASPLHMGLLGDKPVPAWHPASPRVRQAAQEIRAACKDFGVEAAALGLWVCLNKPEFASTFIGISSAAEVVSACEVLDWNPPAALLEAVQRIAAPVFNETWPSGREENQDGRRQEAGHHAAH